RHEAMVRLPRAPLRKLHDQVLTVVLRRRRVIDAAIARGRHRPGERARGPCGGSQEEVSCHAVYFGGVGEVTRPRHPLSVCADRAALPGLRRERATTSHAVRRSEPLAGAERRRYQVRWCLLHTTPPGIEWAHDGARYQSRHRNSSLLRSRDVVKAVLSSVLGIRELAAAQRIVK